MNAAAFIVIAVFTLSGALAAACLRKLIHAALCLVLAFIGLAAFYFFLGNGQANRSLPLHLHFSANFAAILCDLRG